MTTDPFATPTPVESATLPALTNALTCASREGDAYADRAASIFALPTLARAYRGARKDAYLAPMLAVLKRAPVHADPTAAARDLLAAVARLPELNGLLGPELRYPRLAVMGAQNHTLAIEGGAAGGQGRALSALLGGIIGITGDNTVAAVLRSVAMVGSRAFISENGMLGGCRIEATGSGADILDAVEQSIDPHAPRYRRDFPRLISNYRGGKVIRIGADVSEGAQAYLSRAGLVLTVDKTLPSRSKFTATQRGLLANTALFLVDPAQGSTQAFKQACADAGTTLRADVRLWRTDDLMALLCNVEDDLALSAKGLTRNVCA